MSEWISVKDRLPEPYQKDILFVATSSATGLPVVFEGQLCFAGEEEGESSLWEYEPFCYGNYAKDVTHWMQKPPYPDPPEMKEKENIRK